jgi:hypothetical protein
VRALLRCRRADVEQRDAAGRTAVLAATAGNHLAVVQLLIARGADVNAQDPQRDSAFLLAGARGYTDIVRATLAAGADLKSTNRYGGTALIPACHYGHVETVRLLLGTAIDVEPCQQPGLDGAARSGDPGRRRAGPHRDRAPAAGAGADQREPGRSQGRDAAATRACSAVRRRWPRLLRAAGAR